MSVRTVGIDLAKQVFQVHGVDDAGRPVLEKRLRRTELRAFFAGLSPCLIGMEACASAHYWARELAAVGQAVGITAPVLLGHSMGGMTAAPNKAARKPASIRC